MQSLFIIPASENSGPRDVDTHRSIHSPYISRPSIVPGSVLVELGPQTGVDDNTPLSWVTHDNVALSPMVLSSNRIDDLRRVQITRHRSTVGNNHFR